MKTDLIIAGVGGQGILSIGAIIGQAALYDELEIKQAETHGMSQRGGAVVSHVRLSDQPVYADLIHRGQADLILAVEPMEALRQLPFLKTDGYLVTNTEPFRNLSNYPSRSEIQEAFDRLPHVLLLNATDIAHQTGNPKASNLVMLGALSAFIQLSLHAFETGIESVFHLKGQNVIDINQKAFIAGREEALSQLGSSRQTG
ncbi:indolepyruvate oxidoreductase subunit beta [Mangrovibacterium lignilyticum]|uniref:indolepyruvate oxidoreductase subunit beta n=1 Tax=Mangrovibacterium lignilyticum TaxID=2668052 RepID=UPI0013D6D2FB|nr:indolepyruvate oxidoreductase subunit beta [Mangrovibacterium lignilyticum]